MREKRLTSGFSCGIITPSPLRYAVMAQAVEHVLGKDEVTSSNLVNSSRKLHRKLWSFFVMYMEKVMLTLLQNISA